jgi:hypothetical protein
MNSLDLTVLDLAVPAISQGLRPTSTDLLWITDIYGFMVAGFLITIPRCLARSGISAGEGATGEPPSTSGRRHSKRRIRPQTAPGMRRARGHELGRDRPLARSSLHRDRIGLSGGEEYEMGQQVRVRRQRPTERRRLHDLDLRTPSGRILPY